MYTYKTYAMNSISHAPLSDSMLTLAAAIGAGVVNGLSRLILGSLYDKCGFKALFSVLMTSQLLVSLVCYHAVAYPWLYITCILLNYASIGGMYAIFPVSVTKVFGMESGPQIYVWVLLGAVLSSMLIMLTVVYLLDVVGFQALFYMGTASQIVTLGVLWNFEERLDEVNLER